MRPATPCRTNFVFQTSGLRAVLLALLLALLATPGAVAQSTQPARVLKPGESLTDSMPISASDPGSRRTLTEDGDSPPRASGSLGVDLTRLALALAVVIGLIFLARWLVSRWFVSSRAPAASRVVKVLGRTPLAPRQQILLLQVGRRIVVIGESNGNLHTLANLDDPDEVAQLIGAMQEEQIGRATAFGGLFQRAEKNFEAAQADADANAVESPKVEGVEAEREVRSELSGLAEKLRSIRSQIRQSSDGS